MPGTAKRVAQLCKEAGVKTVIAKCANEMHQKILLRVGADQVVFPENESGIRLAKNLLSSGFIDMISLSKDVSMVEIDVKDEWCGKNLIELNLRKKYGFNIVAIKKGQKVNVNINPEQVLDKENTLIVIANTAKRFAFFTVIHNCTDDRLAAEGDVLRTGCAHNPHF